MNGQSEVGRCNRCGRCCYELKDIGATCGHLMLPDNRTCNGKYVPRIRPEEPDTIHIDGDKVIAFSKAVENLAKLFNEIDIFQIKDVFLKGVATRNVDQMIEIEKNWLTAFEAIRSGLKEQCGAIELRKSELERIVLLIRKWMDLSGSLSFKESMANLKQFSDLCDNLAKHRDSGMFELVANITSTPKDKK